MAYKPYDSTKAPLTDVQWDDLQADILATDTSENTKITGLKQLKTGTKIPTKAINATYEQLGNAQASAADALQRVAALENAMGALEQLQADVAALKQLVANNGQSGTGNGESTNGQGTTAQHVYGMVLLDETGKYNVEQWVRIDSEQRPVEFTPNAIYTGMHQVTMGDDVMVEVPPVYVRSERLTTGPYEDKICYWTADQPVDGFHLHPAFLKANGKQGTLYVSAYYASQKADSNLPVSVDCGYTLSAYWNNITYNNLVGVVNRKNVNSEVGWRPYSIYDHHLLARLMMTEFGTPNVRNVMTAEQQFVTADGRRCYRGVTDPFCLTSTDGNSDFTCWLHGLTTEKNKTTNMYTFQVLAGNGSGAMVDTGIPYAADNNNVVPITCYVDDVEVSGVDLGDVFIGKEFVASSTENVGMFGAQQRQIYSTGRAYTSGWRGMFDFGNNLLTSLQSTSKIGLRLTCVV